MLKASPPPIEDSYFQFKLHCKLKVFENEDYGKFGAAFNLVAAASKFGLLFVGTSSNSFQVIQTESIEDFTPKQGEISDYPRRVIDLPSRAKFLAVNCDCSKLLVIVESSPNTLGLIYDVSSFLKQNVQILNTLQLSTNNISVSDISWNPEIPSTFAYFRQDGVLGIFDLAKMDASASKNVGATCICWSPKGKQIAVGISSGEVKQFKPDLKEAKCINKPPMQEPYKPVSVQWISNYKFLVVYLLNSRASFIFVDAPKTGENVYTNHDDVCYSFGDKRLPQFYLIMQHTWNIVIAASANSLEAAVLEGRGEEWFDLTVGDSSRAELPLSASKQETFPIGLAFDTSSKKTIPWGEEEIPPAPYLLFLSTHGVLCCFKTIHLKGQAICKSPESLPDRSGLSFFIAGSIKKSVEAPVQQKVQPVAPAQKQEPQLKADTAPFFGGGQTSITPTKPQPAFSVQQPTQAFNQTTQSIFTQNQPTFGQGPFSQMGGGLLPQPNSSQQSLFGAVAVPPKFAAKHASSTSAPSFQNPPTTSTSIFGGATSTQNAMNIPSTQNLMNIPSTQNVINIPTFKPTSQTSVVVETATNELKNALTKSASEKNIPIATAPSAVIAKPVNTQPVATQPQATEPSTPPTKIDSKKKEELEALLEQKIREDCIQLETELKILLHKAKSLNISLGSDAELTEMVQNTNSLQEFIDEITETTNGQSSEIHTLKQGILQAWAWCEDARSRFSIFQDPTMQAILRAQPLDPVSERQLADINHILYYLDSQLRQAHDNLDEQWNDFQDSCKKSLRIKLPTMEAVYQSMVCQNATLQKQAYILKDIQNRLKRMRRTQPSLPLLVSLDSTDKLENDLKKLQLESVDVVEIQYKKLLDRQRKLTRKKMDQLKNLVEKREVSHISVSKPQITNTSLEVSNLFVAPISPIITKKSVVQKLDFTQSTPKPKIGELKVPNTVSAFTNKVTSVPLVSKPEPTKSLFMSTPNVQPAVTTSINSFAFKVVSSSALIVPSNAPTSTVAIIGAPAAIGLKTTSGSKPLTSAFAPTTQSNLPFGLGKPPTNIVVSSSNDFTNSLFGKPTNSEFSVQSSQNAPLNLSGFGNVIITPVPTTKPTVPASNFSFLTSTTQVVNTSQETVKSTSATLGQNVASSKSFSFNLDSLKAEGGIVTIKPLPTTQASNASAISTTSMPSLPVAASVPSKPTGAIAAFQMPPKTTQATPDGSNQSSIIVAKVTPELASLYPSAQSALVKGSFIGTPTTTTTSSVANSMFGLNFANKPKTSLFGTAAVPSSAFDNKAITNSTITTPQSAENLVKPTTVSCPSVTSNQGVATTSAVIFGTPNKTSTTTDSPASPSTTAESAPTIPQPSSIFGAVYPKTPANIGAVTTTTSIFGTVPIVTSVSSDPANPVFGSKSIFGTPASTSPATSVSDLGKPSIFGSTPTAGSLFGTPTTSVTPSIFGTPTTTSAAFGTSTTTSTGFETSVTTTSGFGTPVTTSSIFAPPITTSSSFGTPTTSSIFGGPTTSPSVFGAPTTTSIFATPATTSTVFGTPANTPSVFGMVASTPSVFGTSTTTVPAFGSPTTTSSGFGAPLGKPSIFGSTPTTGSLFGTPSTAAPVFGTPTTSSTGFGATTAPQSPFGSGSVFGSAPTTTAFGSTTTAAPVFGSTGFGTSTTTASGFGFSNGGSLFGSPGFGTQASNAFATPTTTSASIFGQSSAFGAKPVFGTPTTTTSSLFGSTTTTANVFGSPSTQPNSFSFAAAAANVPAFGATTQNTSTFGFGSLATGTPTTTSGGFGNSSFGQTQNPFASSSGQNQSAFSGGSLFGATTPKTGGGSIFGSSSTTSPFGAKPAFGSSTFGQPSTFGQQSTFGQSSFGSFSNQQSPSGPFSSGTQNVAQAGFGGAFSSPPSGFGAPANFGASSTGGFGASPTFGGAPTFGSPTAFGSPGKVFGGGAAAPTGDTFGSGGQQNSTFANLATQNTLGFGSLAQQSQNAPSNPPAFSGNSSFSTWR